MINRIRAVAVAAALVALPAIASAQDKQFEVGTKLFNLGLLLGSESYGSVGVGGGFEVGFKEISGVVTLGLGGSVGLLRSTVDGFGSDYSFTSIPVLGYVHGHYQLENVPKLDLYGGPAVGVSLTRFSYDNAYCDIVGADCADNDSDVSIGIQAGARWALTPKVLGWGQVSAGNNLPFLNVGVSFKF